MSSNLTGSSLGPVTGTHPLRDRVINSRGGVSRSLTKGRDHGSTILEIGGLDAYSDKAGQRSRFRGGHPDARSACDGSSIGRAPPCQGGCCGSESRPSLQDSVAQSGKSVRLKPGRSSVRARLESRRRGPFNSGSREANWLQGEVRVAEKRGLQDPGLSSRRSTAFSLARCSAGRGRLALNQD